MPPGSFLAECQGEVLHKLLNVRRACATWWKFPRKSRNAEATHQRFGWNKIERCTWCTTTAATTTAATILLLLLLLLQYCCYYYYYFFTFFCCCWLRCVPAFVIHSLEKVCLNVLELGCDFNTFDDFKAINRQSMSMMVLLEFQGCWPLPQENQCYLFSFKNGHDFVSNHTHNMGNSLIVSVDVVNVVICSKELHRFCACPFSSFLPHCFWPPGTATL